MPPEDHPEERAYLLLRKLLSLNTALAISAFLLTACAPLKTAASPPGVSGQTHELSIAAASNLSFAFLELVEQFEEETGGKVRLSLGSSGNLYAQIINGAPFDIFFAADKAYPLRLEEAGRTQPGSFYVYATGGIAVWVPESSPIDVERLGMKALLHPSVQKIAIANPRLAPYGQAALSAMRHYGVSQKVQDKLVLGDTASQAAQFVGSGAASIGIIALPLVRALSLHQGGSYWEVPPETYPKLQQAAVLLKDARNLQEAERFIAFLRQPGGVAIMQRYGFEVPEAPPQ